MNFKIKKRGGIESVVGGLFFLMLMIGGFASIAAALSIYTNLFGVQNQVSNNAVAKANEKFSVLAAANSLTNNLLSVNVKNLGGNSLKLADLWIINNYSPYTATQYSVNNTDAYVSPLHTGNIVATQTITPSPGSYTVKVVSSKGTIQKQIFQVYPLGTVPPAIPDVKFIAANHSTGSGDDVALIMTITNNGLDDLTQVNATYPTVIPPSMLATPFRASIQEHNVTLPAGYATTFMWHAKISGALRQIANVSSTVTAFNSTGAKFTVGTYTNVTINQQPVSPRITPTLSLILPGPMGIASSIGLYGVTITNPIDTTVTVTSVTLILVMPTQPQNTNLFASTVTPLKGSPGSGTWSATVNSLQWTGSVIIPARSGMSFIANATSASKLGTDLPSVLVTASAFTNVGEFSKSGYIVGLSNAGAVPVVNTFLTMIPNSVHTSSVLGNLTGVKSGATTKYNFTLANMDTANTISAGAILSIYIPSGFTAVTSVTTCGAALTFSSCPITSFADGSFIISATVTNAIGPSATPGTGVTYQFTAVAPTLTDTGTYLFFSSASGSTGNSNFPVSALAEVPVQVLHQ